MYGLFYECKFLTNKETNKKKRKKKFRFIWPSGIGGEDFFISANQKQELPVAAMFVNGSGRNEQLT